MFSKLSYQGKMEDMKLAHALAAIKSTLSEPKEETLAQEGQPTKKILRMSVGMAPRLVLGAVFEDGVQVGYLPFQEIAFTVPATPPQTQVLKALDLFPGNAPPDWNSSHPFRILNRFDYNLDQFAYSSCIVSRAERTLILPCWEAFRAFYARETVLANKLVSGSWESSLNDLIRRENTAIDSEGRWQIHLKNGISDASAFLLANLILNPVGRRLANQIHDVHGHSQKRSRPIRTPFPFCDPIDIKVRCLRLRHEPPIYLGMQITEATWPGPIDIVVLRDQAAQLTDGSSQAEATPQPRTRIPRPPDQPIPIDSDHTPDGSTDSARFTPIGISWRNEPQIHRERRISTGSSGRFMVTCDELSAQAAAPGPEGSGTKGFANADYQAEPKGKHNRFEELARALNQLQRDKSIVAWRAVPSVAGQGKRGDHPVWTFAPVRLPKQNRYSNWTFLEPAGTRSALVCEIIVDSCDLYWLEIELKRANEGYQSFLFRLKDGVGLAPVVERLMQAVAEAYGNWGRLTDDSNITDGIAYCRTWVHSYIGNELNTARLLNAIKSCDHTS